MMNWTDTNLLWADGRDILTAAIPLIAEGQALVHAFESGEPKCMPSSGSTTDSFLGVAMGPRRTFSMNNKIEAIVVPAVGPYQVLLTEVASVPVLGVVSAGGAAVASGTGAASPTNVNYSVDPVTGLTLLTFDPSMAGQSLTVAYSYVMTPTEEQCLYGNPNPGFPAETIIGNVQIGLKGRFSTGCWDPRANWYAGGGLPNVKVIAGGIFTDAANAATGVVTTNLKVVTLPSPSSPWLTMEFL